MAQRTNLEHPPKGYRFQYSLVEDITELYSLASENHTKYVARISQTGATAAPTINEYENTTGEALVWSRDGVGTYSATLTATAANVYIPGFGNYEDSGQGRGVMWSDNLTAVCYYDISFYNNKIIFSTYSAADGTTSDMYTLIGASTICLPEIRVYN